MTNSNPITTTKLIDLNGYEGEGEWYKPFETESLVGFLELLTIESDGVQMLVTGRLVDDHYEPMTYPNSQRVRFVQVGVDPYSFAFQKGV